MLNPKTEQLRNGALMLGACAMLAACGGNKDNRATTTDEAGTPAAATTPATGTMGDTGMTGAMTGTTTGAAASGANSTMVSGTLTEPQIMSVTSASNASEIMTSKIAQTKATNANVKAFARDMIKDHQALQRQGDQLAKTLNVTPQSAPVAEAITSMTNQLADRLNSLSGAEFDREYMNAQVEAHQTTLKNLQTMEASAENAQVKQLLQKAIPKVEQHLQRAKDIQGRLAAS